MTAQALVTSVYRQDPEWCDRTSPVGRGCLAVLQAGVESIQLVMSTCEQDLEQAAPLLNLPYMQHST